MDNDVVPELLTKIQQQFYLQTSQSEVLKNALQKLTDNKATYLDVNDFAIEVGNALSRILGDNIDSKFLPDQKMYYNIANRILNPTLKNNYNLISGYASDVQTNLNHNAGLHLKAQAPEFNQDKVDNLVDKISDADNFNDVKWLLNEPIVNFSQSVVDDSIKANAEFHSRAGLHPKITRRLLGDACDWCRNLAGTYDYADAPKDIYRRHERCRCTVDYDPGSGKVQNVWSKKWYKSHNDDKLESRRTVGIPIESGAKNYVRDEQADYLFSKDFVRREKSAFVAYDEIKNSNQSLEKRKIYSNIGKFKSMKDFSKSDVDIAFNHVFNDIHELSDGEGLFRPEYDMAQSWMRLISGKSILNHDLTLLRHERLEHDYMYVVDHLEYDLAHAKTNELYNYSLNIRKKG